MRVTRQRAEQMHDQAWSAYMRAVRASLAGDRSFRTQQAIISRGAAVEQAQHRLSEGESLIKWSSS